MTLFPEIEFVPLIPEPVEKLSADRRRTIRQRADIARGRHPLNGYKLSDDPEAKCGNCRFREVLRYHSRTYPKCTAPGPFGADYYERFGPPNISHGAATDVRAWWPGCIHHVWGDPKVSPDAARWRP